MRRSHLVIENRNSRLFAGTNQERGAGVGREYVQQIVMMIRKVSATVFVMNARDEID